MLRSLVLILVLVNAAFFAWTQGWLNAVVGVRPDAQREPQRLTQQVHPEKVVVVQADALPAASATPPASAASAASAPAEPASTPASSEEVADTRTQCFEAGPFASTDRAQVEALLKPFVPVKARELSTTNQPGMWMVYMGPYPDSDTLNRKEAELKRIKGLEFDEVHSPASLSPGLSLGRFSKQENANKALDDLKNRGIRTARIVTLRPGGEMTTFRIPEANAAQAAKLPTLKLPQSKSFSVCKR